MLCFSLPLVISIQPKEVLFECTDSGGAGPGWSSVMFRCLADEVVM